jgi:hypothetical protein
MQRSYYLMGYSSLVGTAGFGLSSEASVFGILGGGGSTGDRTSIGAR